MSQHASLEGRELASEAEAGQVETTTRRAIRGSTLLLSGRAISLGVKFLVQVLVVRYLTAADYGAWAYALSVVAFLGGFAALSLDRAVTRFASIYHQRGQFAEFFGTLVLVVGAILVTGILFVTGLYAFPGAVARALNVGEQPLVLLAILVFLVPLEALDHLVISIFATFRRAKPIFFRRYVLTPSIQLGVVVLLILRSADVTFLAYGYLVGTALGVIIYGGLLVRLFREEGLLDRFRPTGVRVPAREVFSFTVPLMTSDWLSALIQSSGALLLGYFYDMEQIAVFRVVVPIAALNQVVLQSFNLLYVPDASRMFASDDHAGIGRFYRRTAVWIAVFSFPVFAVTFCLATPLTVTFFGAEYAGSGPLLAVLAVGQYLHAALGFNGATLKVMGHIRHVVVINLLAAVANVALTLLLVPPFGAAGAALALSASLVAHNVLKQLGLRHATGIHLLSRESVGPYAVVTGAGSTLIVARLAGLESVVLLVLLAIAASLGVIWLTKRMLAIDDVFPEVARVPVLGALVT